MDRNWCQLSCRSYQMDNFASLFRHFTPTARAFFTGNLCAAADFEDEGQTGFLHILRGGGLHVVGPSGGPLHLTTPCLILMPQYVSHRFEPDPQLGADLLCARIQVGGQHGNPIALGLPDTMIIPLDGVATISLTLDLLLAEAFAAYDGRQIALDRLFEYLIVQIIRHVIDEHLVAGGVLAAMADPRLARAVTAMHDSPERMWTLDDLADVAGMSRTGFARHFRAVAGVTAMDHLTKWRMTIAQDLLRQGKSIKAITAAVGYNSPEALTRAFGKTVGASPRDWLKSKLGST